MLAICYNLSLPFNTYSSYLYWVWGSMLGVRDMALNYTITLLHLLCVIRIKPCFLFSLPEAQPKLPSSLAWFIPIASCLMAAHFSILPGKSHGQRSLVGCSPWGHWGSDMTERLHFHFSLSCIEVNDNPLQCSCKGRGSLVGCRLWGHTELDMTEAT